MLIRKANFFEHASIFINNACDTLIEWLDDGKLELFILVYGSSIFESRWNPFSDDKTLVYKPLSQDELATLQKAQKEKEESWERKEAATTLLSSINELIAFNQKFQFDLNRAQEELCRAQDENDSLRATCKDLQKTFDLTVKQMLRDDLLL